VCWGRKVKDRLPKWRARGEGAYARTDEVLGGSLTVLRSAVERFTEVRGSQAAASLSYYAFFSLFPLLLFLLIAAGALLGREQAYAKVVQFVGAVLPVGQDVVRRTIEQGLAGAASLQLVAALGLLWSATGFFSTLVSNIDLGWPDVKAANIVRQRLYGLLMVGVLTLLLMLSLLLNVLVDLLLRLRFALPVVGLMLEKARWPTTTRLLATAVALLLLFGLYWAVPKAKVRWQAAAIGALVATLAMYLVSWGFSRLVASGLTRYETVYGSLGAVVALLFWMYLSSWTLLVGAHLTAAIDRHAVIGRPGAPSSPTSA
jgi:membrane protein